MKVLLTTDAVGGVWQYTAELAMALAGQGVACVVANLGPSPDADQRAMLGGTVAAHPSSLRTCSGVHCAPQEVLTPLAGEWTPEQARGDGGNKANAAPITFIDTGLPLDWMCDAAEPVLRAGDAIAALATEYAVDLIHYNMPTLAVRRPSIPAIAVAHGCVSTWWEAARDTPLDQGYRWHRTLTAQGLREVERVVAPTAAYAQVLARHYRLESLPTAVHNGRTAAVLPASDGPLPDIALTVGRLWDGVKNAGLLDRAAARLPIPFLAAGATRGPHGETIRLDHLRALGHLSGDRIAEHLASRPIFVSAARFEPFGLAVLEAAQAGCALVLADIPTFRELWDGAATFVSLDSDGWCRAIEALVLAPDTRAALGEAARTRAARYTPAATADAMHALYRETLAARPAARKAAA